MTHPLKDHARRLRASLATLGLTVTHVQALDLTARAHGFESWRTLTAARYSVTPVTLPEPEVPGRFTLEFSRAAREVAVEVFYARDYDAARVRAEQLRLSADLTWSEMIGYYDPQFERLVPPGAAPLTAPGPEEGAPRAPVQFPRATSGIRYVAHLERYRTERARITVDALGQVDATTHPERFLDRIPEDAWVPTDEVTDAALLDVDADFGALSIQ
ncbi:glyoxalase superfamily protein [Deinococcus soli (ex Cha et al. 2016)]|uniref:Glyoxalase-related protein domain-containing protein n=2 Tax=Deinococcus soli (ex Cha et al. 2016) TaxID=1309411 RepID=A0AAE3XFL1_9DEIO|nr:glyoxalase superfamily protein [Deinococcus soli (ex Cha et al. 2016)]MDR6218818.1 hypothetical protein [Deinococcus soli (ex Cha et al. 2016)]MDR6328615.1 hypothetical protein [Deinococcus soli (ex Cha et al. 2016)]MDR6751898.1 hypothetical protein [Deinococcus soli (ex Cha et al. 2016)]